MKNKTTGDKVFRTGYNRQITPTRGEVNTLPSMTIPDMGYSLKEILDRFTNGMPLSIAKEPYYEDNPDEDFDLYDETRDPSFDLEDASMRLNELNDAKQYQEKINKNKQQLKQKTDQKTTTQSTDLGDPQP